jgi:hypothetical protein
MHTESGINVAIKAEQLDVLNSWLMHETKIYKALRGNAGVPDIYWAGTEGNFNVVVMELLG